MTDDRDLIRARKVGGETAAGVAVVTGAALALLARRSGGLLASVAAVTVGVALFSFFAGRIAGAKIRRGGWAAAVGVGVLGGLAALLAAAVCAAAAGAVWGLADGARDPGWLGSYVGKPFLAVLGYGCMVAPVVGGATGAIIRGRVGNPGKVES